MDMSQENAKNQEIKASKKVCYCGKERNLSIVEVACSNCHRFFHESCIGYQFGKILSFSMNYVFTCKLCSVTGLESYRRMSATIPQICITALANLQRKTEKNGSPKYLFNKDEIISFVDMYWESITTIGRKQTNSWHFNIIKTLQAHSNLFISQDCDGETLYGLVESDLTTIRPHYDSAKFGNKDEGNKKFAFCEPKFHWRHKKLLTVGNLNCKTIEKLLMHKKLKHNLVAHPWFMLIP